ncbi:hypothetical protein CC80DRAFT_439752 [Byssothecium circinans]|uniref:Extracellular membrane protein CFEM domain-containing protein n=1 Tax=Byssothecium circinans TaxID=147558 RepID=A0A6A5UF65_9PLEO|nr:hypothetical protein CC80DRAFT_439752 [Byssothecium circinans]
MRLFRIWLGLLTVAICRVTAQGALDPTKSGPNDDDHTLVPLVNRNGWVNPEDLIPMPQCIAQQDQSDWLSTMTKCTSKQCTSHFGIICTHHQWLTQLSCLSTSFSSDVVKPYLPYCSRSVLAKAQLFRWIQNVTGRTWLVDVGDATGLQNLSPASLIEGYAAVSVTDKAPACLTDSASAPSMEPFQHVMASCGFTSNTQHTGNTARPWEYSESLRSMIALDFETVGYDLTKRWIGYGDYFDKRCFCKAFNTDPKNEPCSAPALALTRERLWLNATCGPTSLPGNWTDGLKTTTFAYIPTENWRWPDCVTSMPKKVTDLTDRCSTDACEPDSSGYCKVKRSVDRACFCRNISYSTCKGACQIFETRIDYIKWLHSLCGSVQGWQGLPKHWRQLAAPTPVDMIPWRWSIKLFKDSNSSPVDDPNSSKPTQTCASTEWKLGSLGLINIATLLAAFYGSRTGSRRSICACRHYHSRSWLLKGLTIAALYLFANWINAVLVQSTPGYEDIPVVQLILLWCSIPRPTWATILLVGVQHFQVTSFSTVASCLFAEAILQTLSAFHIIAAVNYGLEHNFYSQGMAILETVPSARLMYAGALMWLVVVVVALVLLIQAVRGTTVSARNAKVHASKSQTNNLMTLNAVEELMAPFNERWREFEDMLVSYWMERSWDLEQTPLLSGEGQVHAVYGTLPLKGTNSQPIERGMVRLFLIAIISMVLLWIAQWLFWVGLIGLSSEGFCLPNFGVLIVIWIASSLAVGLAVVVS